MLLEMSCVLTYTVRDTEQQSAMCNKLSLYQLRDVCEHLHVYFSCIVKCTAKWTQFQLAVL
uniref:Uncharacterized protein n=1 Tax=Anguilla anguilla TaxID=7936 RepID=A0A0E9WF91_ANGAN